MGGFPVCPTVPVDKLDDHLDVGTGFVESGQETGRFAGSFGHPSAAQMSSPIVKAEETVVRTVRMLDLRLIDHHCPIRIAGDHSSRLGISY